MKIHNLIVAAFLSAALLAACTNQSEENAQAQPGAVRAVKVGTMGTYEPFSFQDENGRLTGYDIEVLREVESRLNGVRFEFIAGPWDSLFVGLDADKFQILANQITSNPDREARYLLTDKSYFADITQPIVRSDNESIKTLEDLSGKTVGATVGDSHTRALEDFNQKIDGKIDIRYYEGDINAVLQDLVSGRIDATVNNPIMARRKAELLDLPVKPVNESLIEHPAYFIMKRDAAGQFLKEEIDRALAEMENDGSLSRLSTEWFGQDYTGKQSHAVF